MPNVPVPTPPGSWFGLKFHQVAIYTNNILAAVEQWENTFGAGNWVYDSATLVGVERIERRQASDPDRELPYRAAKKVGHMAFNYDILPCELEYVSYSTPTRHPFDERTGAEPFISHMSVYVADIKDEISRIYVEHDGAQPYHRFHTEEHHNPNLPEGTYFEEAIYDTSRTLGFDLKLIQKCRQGE